MFFIHEFGEMLPLDFLPRIPETFAEGIVEVYEIAIKKAPEEADILLCLGRAYLMVKRHQHKFGSVLEKLAGIDSEKAMELEACMMRNIIPGRNKNKRKKNKK